MPTLLTSPPGKGKDLNVFWAFWACFSLIPAQPAALPTSPLLNSLVVNLVWRSCWGEVLWITIWEEREGNSDKWCESLIFLYSSQNCDCRFLERVSWCLSWHETSEWCRMRRELRFGNRGLGITRLPSVFRGKEFHVSFPACEMRITCAARGTFKSFYILQMWDVLENPALDLLPSSWKQSC